MRAILKTALLTVLVSTALACSERDVVSPTTEVPATAEGLTASGWSRFTSNDLDSALADFAQAIALDPTHGPAYVGRGWTRVGRALTANNMADATSDFDGALSRGQSSAETRAGRAAANLGQEQFSAAVADAQSARTLDANFTFAHRTSFDSKDLHLVEAFALAGQGNLTDALVAADLITASGIVVGSPATWTVNGTTFDTFEDATLAFLQKMSEEHAG